jgi:hypothetical protein
MNKRIILMLMLTILLVTLAYAKVETIRSNDGAKVDDTCGKTMSWF